MLYRRTPELPPLRHISNGIISDAVYPDEKTQTSPSAGEMFSKSFWLETSLTKDGDCNLPAAGSDTARTIVSRKYNADMAFRNSLNEISAVFAKITDLSTSSLEAELIRSTSVDATVITTDNITANYGTFDYLSSDEISCQELSVDNGLVHNISGKNLHYDNGQINDLRSDNIHTTNITATGLALLSAAATYWADLAEMYKSGRDLPPGTLIKFNGQENEIEIASDGVANGVISKNPALLMNSSLKKDQNNSNPVIMLGRSIVLVKDAIDKFDRIELSDTPGIACRAKPDSNRHILGISLESKFDPDIRPVECVVKLAI